MKQGQSISTVLLKQSEVTKNEYRIRLNASIDVSRFLLHQGLAYRGHDEYEESNNRGNFLEMIKYTANQNELIDKIVLRNAPANNQMVSPKIQKYIAHCFDESSDNSYKEQMDVVLRYVDRCGIVKERFVGVVHVMETYSLYLKSTIDFLFAKYRLSLKNIRGQGYDGASNMRALVSCCGSCKETYERREFFRYDIRFVECGWSFMKRKDMIRERHQEKMKQSISKDEIVTGTGLNQEITFKRARDTRWGSHYKTLLRLVELFSTIVENDEADDLKRRQAYGLIVYFQSFDFVFYLQLMLLILRLTNSLSLYLQRKDQDILNAIALVKSTKRQLQKLRDHGWDSLLKKVRCFCEKHDISILKMEKEFVDPKRSRQKTNVTNLHHYMVDSFYTVVDMQLQEFNNRFDEVNSKMLICLVSLDPSDSFLEFDTLKLLRMVEFYSDNFSLVEKMTLEHQLNLYIDDVCTDDRFSNLKSISELAKLMVDAKKHISYYLVYRLLKLVLILPIATAIVERCFSGMNIVKSYLRNKIGDEF